MGPSLAVPAVSICSISLYSKVETFCALPSSVTLNCSCFSPLIGLSVAIGNLHVDFHQAHGGPNRGLSPWKLRGWRGAAPAAG